MKSIQPRRSTSKAITSFSVTGALCLVFLTASSWTVAKPQSTSSPTKLQCDALTTPLGVDSKQPSLSWWLQDSRPAAKQTSYQIQVATEAASLTAGKADVWDSGRVESEVSSSVPYAGPALLPAKRYYWRVTIWDKDRKPYPASEVTWFETGFIDAQNWRANWITFEDDEVRSIRHADASWIAPPTAVNHAPNADNHHDYRFTFELDQPVKRAILFVTGKDTAAAWVNATRVLEAQPFPPWKQMPWRKYTRTDITANVHTGNNLVAVEITAYPTNSPEQAQAPMSASIFIEKNDGSTQVLRTGQPGWKWAFNAGGEWHSNSFDDSSWTEATTYLPAPSNFGSSDLGKPWPTDSVKALRRTFDVSKPVASARLYATALGAYKFFLNGKPVGDQILAPGWMDYRQHVPYQAYDVTSSVRSGKNAISSLLAPGWYSTPLMWFGQGNNYGDTPPALKAQLRIDYADGSVDWIATDEAWRAADSPILKSELYDGETFDARRVLTGWETPTFADRTWKSVELIHPAEPQIVSQYFQPIREKNVLTAKSVTTPKPGVFIFDFGQNLVGVPRLRVQGLAGTDIQLRFAEVLNPDGTLYVENLRTAKATDHFILAGRGVESYQPMFTFHGFRYVEISGLSVKPDANSLKAVVFHTDAPFTAQLRTGNLMVNQLWNNILWGQRSNFVGVPTDCPQRDERLGWSADAQVFWRTAAFNMDLRAFSRKFAGDLRGTQVGSDMYGIFAPGTITPHPGYGAGWSDAGVIIPWTSWIQTGDKQIIEQNWEAMEKYLNAIAAANPDYLWKKNYGIPFGDWLSPEGVTPEDLVATAYWAYDVTLMRQMAHAAGRTADERKYDDLFQNIKAAFNKAYVRPDGFVGGVPPPPVFASGAATKLSDTPVETQTGYVLALYTKLLPDSLRDAVAKRLVDKIAANGGRLATGFLGTPYLLAALSDTGHSDVAYRLLLNTQYPSWGYLIEHGATTMWERWNGDQMRHDPSMNSYNHYAYGAVAEWIYRYAAGVDTVPSDPGFHTILLHPNFDSRLGSVDFSYDSVYGKIKSAWSIKGNSVDWTVTIPPNTKALLPVSAGREASYILDGRPIADSSKARAAAASDGATAYELPAGTYTFEVKIAAPPL